MIDRGNRQRGPVPDPADWLEALPAPVLGLDAGLRIRFANAAAAELFAGTGLLGRRLEEAFAADTLLLGLTRRARDEASGLAAAEVPIGGVGRFSVAAAPVGEQGFIALVLAQAPRTSPALAGAFSAARTLAHEVRNPLAGIRAAAQLIARGEDEETRVLAKLICDEADRVHRLTERIDPLGALEPARADAVNVHEALGRVRKILAPNAPAIAFHERYDPSLPAVRGDFDQLIQAFLNIAKNAVEAIGARAGGEIVFATAYRPGLKVRAGPASSARAQLEVQIADNGPGLDPAIAERLFEPFATTKSGGMGLGLNVTADIVARHHGRIEVKSAPGRTAFHILLPIAAGETP